MMKAKRHLTSLLAGAGALALSACVSPYYLEPAATTYTPGHYVDTLPRGYTTVTYDGVRYYRDNDVFFRPRGSGYVVVETPDRFRGDRDQRRGRDGNRGRPDRGDRYDRGMGSYVPRLPDGYRTVRHRGTPYYVYQDTYYEPRGNGYVVIAPPF